MAIYEGPTPINTVDTVVGTAKPNRSLNIIAYEFANTDSAVAVVQVKDGLGGTVIATFVVGSQGGLSHEDDQDGDLLGRILGLGKDLVMLTVGAAPGLSVVVEYGRV